MVVQGERRERMEKPCNPRHPGCLPPRQHSGHELAPIKRWGQFEVCCVEEPTESSKPPCAWVFLRGPLRRGENRTRRPRNSECVAESAFEPGASAEGTPGAPAGVGQGAGSRGKAGEFPTRGCAAGRLLQTPIRTRSCPQICPWAPATSGWFQPRGRWIAVTRTRQPFWPLTPNNLSLPPLPTHTHQRLLAL